MPVSINPDITILDDFQVAVSGTAKSENTLVSVEVFDQDNDLGSATFDHSGNWTFTDYPPSIIDAPPQLLSARSIDYFGNVEYSDKSLVLGVDDPSDDQIYSGVFGDSTATIYGPHGRALYDLSNIDNSDPSKGFVATGRGGKSIEYGLFSGYPETIENFRVAGPAHDVLDLSKSEFSNLAQVLRQTSNAGGEASIHFGDGSSLTLEGVTKHQLATHRQDFSFG